MAPASLYAVKALCVIITAPFNAIVGSILSSTVTFAVAVEVLFDGSVTVKITLTCPTLSIAVAPATQFTFPFIAPAAVLPALAAAKPVPSSKFR